MDDPRPGLPIGTTPAIIQDVMVDLNRCPGGMTVSDEELLVTPCCGTEIKPAAGFQSVMCCGEEFLINELQPADEAS